MVVEILVTNVCCILMYDTKRHCISQVLSTDSMTVECLCMYLNFKFTCTFKWFVMDNIGHGQQRKSKFIQFLLSRFAGRWTTSDPNFCPMQWLQRHLWDKEGTAWWTTWHLYEGWYLSFLGPGCKVHETKMFKMSKDREGLATGTAINIDLCLILFTTYVAIWLDSVIHFSLKPSQRQFWKWMWRNLHAASNEFCSNVF